MPQSFADSLYLLCCAVAFVAAVDLQLGRHRRAKACVWWAYTVLTIGLAWEALDAWNFGPPDFPSTRWVLLPALAVVEAAAALKDRFGKT